MKRCISTIAFIIILAICCFVCSGCTSETGLDMPEWLDGVLMISTMGADEPVDSDDVPIDQYVCAFDFSNRKIETIRVPAHARLMKYKDDTILLYRKNGLYGTREQSDVGIYRTYGALKIVKALEDNSYCMHPLWREIKEPTLSVNPLVVYGMIECTSEKSWAFDDGKYRIYYYLGYGVSDDGDLEYQLISESSRDEITVLRHYPLDYGIWHNFVSISPDGKIAWREVNPYPKEGEVFALHDGEVVQLKDEEQYTYAMCWLDDDRLLYMARITDPNVSDFRQSLVYVPRIWHLNTGEIEDLNAGWSENKVKLSLPPVSIAVDPSGRFIASYVSTHFDGLEQIGRIAIFSLEDGKNWIFNPWSQEVDRPGSLFNGYMKGSGDVIIYDPGDMIDAQVVWYQ